MTYVERFGIAPAVATRDFTAYRELAPQNIDFEGRRKVYIPSERFVPVFDHVPERVLSAISRGFGDGDDRCGGSYLPCELPVRLNRPSLEELAVVTRAIHQKRVLQVKYHSYHSSVAQRIGKSFLTRWWTVDYAGTRGCLIGRLTNFGIW